MSLGTLRLEPHGLSKSDIRAHFWRYRRHCCVDSAPLGLGNSVFRRLHRLRKLQGQEFAARGVGQIEPARQMDRIFRDCRHYITYGPNQVPIFNSVASFGDRYILTMQVPVEIKSGKSGSMIAEPQFYLDEISSITVSPLGAVGASYSRNLEFGVADWKRLCNADGDFSVIGFNINPTPVAKFKQYIEAMRPSN